MQAQWLDNKTIVLGDASPEAGKTYIVAIGWDSTFVGRRGVRLPRHADEVKSYNTQLKNRRAELRDELQRHNDDLLEFWTVYAERRSDVAANYAIETVA